MMQIAEFEVREGVPLPMLKGRGDIRLTFKAREAPQGDVAHVPSHLHGLAISHEGNWVVMRVTSGPENGAETMVPLSNVRWAERVRVETMTTKGKP